MTKKCSQCGSEVSDDAKFCMNCGYNFTQNKKTLNIFENGKIFLIIIAIVVILGLSIIATSNNTENLTIDDSEPFDLTISSVSGWDSDNGSSYTLYTEAIFKSVPDDLSDYTIKTTYNDKNNTEIGHETETLDKVYYETNYPISFGYYTSYKLPDVDNVVVEIYKSGKVVDNFTEKVDRNKIEFLN